MTDTTHPAPVDVSDVNANRKRHRIVYGLCILAGCLVLVGVIFAYGPYVQSYSQNALLGLQQMRQQAIENTKVAPAVLVNSVSTTDLAKTDAGRAVYVETVKTVIDPVAEMNSMKQSLAATTKSLTDQVAAMKTELENARAAATAKAVQMASAQQAPVSAPNSAPQNQAQAEPEAKVANTSGRPTVNFDRSGIPENWQIRRVVGQEKAEKCPGTIYVKRSEQLPDGGVRRFFGCR